VGAGLASVEMRRHGRSGAAACGWKLASGLGGFFIFIFFISVFYKNIFSTWKFTEIYPGRPAAGRPVAARQTGARGLSAKKKTTKNCRQVTGDRSPGSWAAGPPPLYKVSAAPHPLICLTKNLEKKKREGGRERRGEGEAKRRSLVGFSSRRL